MLFAGIGSRETPPDVLRPMSVIGRTLTFDGHILRSGGARGADQAFESFAVPERKEIFYAADAAKNWSWFPHAQKYHPRWGKLTTYAKELHARNSAIICGKDLHTPVDFVVCWTCDGGPTGGTGQALRIAADLGIPVFNLYWPTAHDAMKTFVSEKTR